MLSLLISMLVPAIWTCRGKQSVSLRLRLIFPHLEDGQHVVVLRADVAVATEWRHGDGVGVQHGQVITVAAVNDPDTAVAGRKPPGENRNEGGGEDDLGDRAGLQK